MTFPAAALILAVLAPPLHAAPFAELPFAPAIVTWHTAVPARRMTYVVEAPPQGGTFEPGRFASRRGRGRRSFKVILEPRRIRSVAVSAYARDRPLRQRTVVVPVSG